MQDEQIEHRAEQVLGNKSERTSPLEQKTETVSHTASMPSSYSLSLSAVSRGARPW